MLILAADTSGKNGSIALVRFDSDTTHTVEVVPLEGGTFSAQLVPQISALFEKHGIAKEQIYALVVASGPGSFTGLRVGLAAIKALGEVLKKPIAAVSVLEAVAIAGATEGHVLAALDAGRGEVYCAEYEVHGWHAIERSKKVLTEQEFFGLADGLRVITPDENVGNLARKNDLDVSQVKRPRADFIAHIGFEKIEEGETVSPGALDATYIRRSDAEIIKSSSSHR